MDLQILFRQAVGFHQKGNLAETERLCLQILRADPDHFDAGSLLGMVCSQQGRDGEALKFLAHALKINPRSARTWSNYGLALGAQQRFDEALASYDRALALEPHLAGVHYNRGNILRALRRFAEALASYDAVLAVDPNHVDALNNRGLALAELGRFEDALQSYDKALGIRPGFPITLNNRGTALRQLDRPQEALASFDGALAAKPDHLESLINRAPVLWGLGRFEDALNSYHAVLAIAPDHVEALYGRGLIFLNRKRFDDALASFDRVLAVRRDHADAWNNRGILLAEMKRYEEALASFDGILAARPDHGMAWNNRGEALRFLKRFDEALASFDRAIAIDPQNAKAFFNRATMQWSEYGRYDAAIADFENVLRIEPDYDYARGDLLHLRMHGGDWRDFERDCALVTAGIRAGKRVARPFIYQPISSAPADLQACARIYTQHLYPPEGTLRTGASRAASKIRVGYVSGEFRAHATAFLTAGLFESHDKSRFDIVAFDNGRRQDSNIRRRLEAAFGKWVDIADLSDADAARKILGEEIDILVDLNGYFGALRTGVFAKRPAPVQVNFLGFPGTMGAPYMDYIIADRFVIPQDEQRHYTENVVTLPDSYQVNDSRRRIAENGPGRAACGLPEDAFVFCNFNQSYKLTPEMFAVWMRILRQTENGVLWMMENNARFAQNMRQAVIQQDVGADRLVFASFNSLDNHLARLKLADLFLDTLPYNAHTTASDALWAGLPLVTCRGRTFPGRVAASLLGAVGLPELVTDSLEQYEALALKIARDPALAQSLRRKLGENRWAAPLFDTGRYTRHLESAYTTMWEFQTRGEKPRGFTVTPTS